MMNATLIRSTASILVVLVAQAGAQTGESKRKKDPHRLNPEIHGKELIEATKAAYEKGIDYLVARQNKDGTWGSHHPHMANLKDFGFRTGSRGSHDGVRLACTAIIATALLRDPNRTPARDSAFIKACNALLDDKRFAYDMGEAFNTWGYGYKLAFLAEFLAATEDEELRSRAHAAARVCVRGLRRYQLVDGGWNYYATPLMGGTSMSFNTANFVEALELASREGVRVPRGMIDDAKKLVIRMRTRRGGVIYDARFFTDGGSVNELSSSSRTAACTEALVELGAYGRDDIENAIEVWDEGERWLEQGRKLIQPHSAVHQISGYFFFYGYHYYAELLSRLGAEVDTSRWERLAWTMLRTQEPNGSWWDTPAADYGDKWGTGFSLLVIQRALKALEDKRDTTHSGPANPSQRPEVATTSGTSAGISR